MIQIFIQIANPPQGHLNNSRHSQEQRLSDALEQDQQRRSAQMATPLLKAILTQSPQIQLLILLAFISDSSLESLKISEQTLLNQQENGLKTQKFLKIMRKIGEFSFVNGISWFDPVSGLCIGLCLFLWHLVHDEMKEKNK